MVIIVFLVLVVVVLLVLIIGVNYGIGQVYSILEILVVLVFVFLVGVLMVVLWSLCCGKDLDKDLDFQVRIKDFEQCDFIYGLIDILLNQVFLK